MRKIWAIFVMGFVLLGLGACAGEGGPGKKMFNFEGAVYVVLRDGNTGNAVAIRDPADLEKLRDMFYAPQYEKHISSEEYTGWGWWLQWYSEDGEPVEDITVQGADRIRYKDAMFHEYFWKVSGGEIDTAYLGGLLARAPEAGVADLNPRMEYVRGEPFSVTIEDAAGNLVDIRDSGLMGEILDDLLGLTFVVGEASDREPAYTVMWGTEDRELIDSVMIVDASTVWRSGYLYHAVDGKIDIESLREIVEGRRPNQIKTEGAAYILLQSGIDGRGATICDPETAAQLEERICTPRYKKVIHGGGLGAAAYHLIWFSGDGKKIDELMVSGNLYCDGDSYEPLEGEFDSAYLKELLETMPDPSYPPNPIPME